MRTMFVVIDTDEARKEMGGGGRFNTGQDQWRIIIARIMIRYLVCPKLIVLAKARQFSQEDRYYPISHKELYRYYNCLKYLVAKSEFLTHIKKC